MEHFIWIFNLVDRDGWVVPGYSEKISSKDFSFEEACALYRDAHELNENAEIDIQEIGGKYSFHEGGRLL